MARKTQTERGDPRGVFFDLFDADEATELSMRAELLRGLHRSAMIGSLRGDLAALHKAGAIGKVTVREFDAACPRPVRELGAVDIKRLKNKGTGSRISLRDSGMTIKIRVTQGLSDRPGS